MKKGIVFSSEAA